MTICFLKLTSALSYDTMIWLLALYAYGYSKKAVNAWLQQHEEKKTKNSRSDCNYRISRKCRSLDFHPN